MGKMIFGAAAAIAASMALASPAMAATELVTNGNFEAGLSGWNQFPGMFNGNPDIFALKGSAYIGGQNGGTGSTASANNTFASFGPGNKTNVGTLVSNSFSTVAGTVYKLTFDYAQFLGTANTEVLNYFVFGDNGTLLSGIEKQAGGTDLDTIFAHHTLYFTATGTSANVAFSLAGSATNGTDGLLDNVSITAVPEASTWAMFILGFGALGVSYRRRKQVVSFA